MRRIYITGAAGVGKTTLARTLETKYELGKYLPGSSKAIWDAWGINNHLDIITRSARQPEWGQGFQLALLEYREKLLNVQTHSIISDRSPIDNIVYYKMQNSMYQSTQNTANYIERARSIFKDGDYLIFKYFPYYIGEQVIEDDGYRVDNYYYQKLVQELIKIEIAELQKVSKVKLNVITLPYHHNRELVEILIEELVSKIKK